MSYEPGTIATWVDAFDATRRIAIRREDGWHMEGNLPDFTDEHLAKFPTVEILDPLQIDWRKKYEHSISSLVAKQERWTRTRASIEFERDNNASAHRRAEQKIRELENELQLAKLAVTDVERLKDAEIAKLKARIAELETKPVPLRKLDLLRDTLVEVEDLVIKLRQGI